MDLKHAVCEKGYLSQSFTNITHVSLSQRSYERLLLIGKPSISRTHKTCPFRQRGVEQHERLQQ